LTRYGIQEGLESALETVVNDEILEIINELAGIFLGLTAPGSPAPAR
jgi:hypothetical protein